MIKKNGLPRDLNDPSKETDMLDMDKIIVGLPRELQIYIAGAIDMAATMPYVKPKDTEQKPA